MFAGTLGDNLTLAAPDATDYDLLAALRTIGAPTLLDVLPDGLDTRVGTVGHQVTAVQAQQVALTRVVLADPDLAIFDEATAEAGSAHADLLDRAADAALAGRTGLVIAHRLSQAAVCDRIVVMDHGRIAEEGPTPTSSPPAAPAPSGGRRGRAEGPVRPTVCRTLSSAGLRSRDSVSEHDRECPTPGVARGSRSELWWVEPHGDL